MHLSRSRGFFGLLALLLLAACHSGSHTQDGEPFVPPQIAGQSGWRLVQKSSDMVKITFDSNDFIDVTIPSKDKPEYVWFWVRQGRPTYADFADFCIQDACHAAAVVPTNDGNYRVVGFNHDQQSAVKAGTDNLWLTAMVRVAGGKYWRYRYPLGKAEDGARIEIPKPGMRRPPFTGTTKQGPADCQ